MSLLHHPSPDALAAYASGRLGRGLSLVVDVHLHACADCRGEIRRLEAVGGALLNSVEPARMEPDALARALARIEAPPPPEPPRARADPVLTGIDLGVALEGLQLGTRRWLAPGIWMRPVIREQGRISTYLIGTGPGRRMPRHGHAGAEFVCVLHGGYSDEEGQYGPGDFSESDAARVHTPRADDDGECICLISSEGPMLMHSLAGRLLRPFFGV
jgi:putative transcriptional regulator